MVLFKQSGHLNGKDIDVWGNSRNHFSTSALLKKKKYWIKQRPSELLYLLKKIYPEMLHSLILLFINSISGGWENAFVLALGILFPGLDKILWNGGWGIVLAVPIETSDPATFR